MKVLPFVILCLTAAAFADDFKLVSGKEYKNVTITPGWSLTASC